MKVLKFTCVCALVFILILQCVNAFAQNYIYDSDSSEICSRTRTMQCFRQCKYQGQIGSCSVPYGCQCQGCYYRACKYRCAREGGKVGQCHNNSCNCLG